MIDTRHPHPAHIRDLLLLAAATAADERIADAGVLTDLDIVDVLAIAATMAHGQLRALTAGVRSVDDRIEAAAEAFALAQSIADEPVAVGAIGTVVGAIAQGEQATAAAITQCLAAFDEHELANAAVALSATMLVLLARSADATVTEIVQWSAGDGAPRTATRATRPAFCLRDDVNVDQPATTSRLS